MSEKVPGFDRYLQLESDFTDFLYFQGDAEQRSDERRAFMDDEIYVPHYTYPRLSGFTHDIYAIELGRALHEASFGLYEAPESPKKSIQLSYIHKELSHIALVSAATSLHGSNLSYETTRSSFLKSNLETYGEYDYARGRGMLRTEKERTERYNPNTLQSQRVKDELLELLAADMNIFETEPALMNTNDLAVLHSEAWSRWGKELQIIPDTDGTVIYDAASCAALLERSLKSDGLAAAGWIVEVSTETIVPMTSPAKKCITLPADIAYTASDIRRILIGHEQKIHAWRAENGDKSGNLTLKTGTSSSLDAEEGLGIIMECAIEGNLDNPSLHRARDRYITAGLALGVDGKERDAREVYEIMWRIIALRDSSDGSMNVDDVRHSKNMAYTHVENAFRGTPFWRKGVIYTKLKVYFEGLVANVEYMKEFQGNIEAALDTAMVGKYDHTSRAERAYFVN